ncbi:MAG: RMD1 family protein [Hyphomicrobium zavarzinii]|uniref:RMD1 family protein n=1 Tax=Hyphomicrobium zavarzinii TaxID=48292 RepID=UPI001A5E3E56|nr:RMD1 family protein [Hyphomicrobium zavarzinii]MBL8844291.1 RMD1 family protein [Hyphomicrobium zavarzinii]
MDKPVTVRALQLGERIDLRGLEREDTFSTSPLAFRTPEGGAVVLFKSGTAVFVGLTPVAEDALIDSLAGRIAEPIEESERESETAHLVVKPDADDLAGPAGTLHIRSLDANRLVLIAQALATSVAMAYDERRIAQAFERIAPLAERLKGGRLPEQPQAELLRQIGDALLIQQRLAGRVDLDEKPDVLWDHPEVERLWTRLVDEYDLTVRSRAIARKLEAIQETSATLTDLVSTRTSHRLEWYIIALILLEVVLGLYDRIWK